MKQYNIFLKSKEVIIVKGLARFRKNSACHLSMEIMKG
jgi:hypothetical protein